MKNLNLIFASFMMLFIGTSCGTMKFATMEVQNPIKTEYRNDTDSKYRGVGTGESVDSQMAYDMARTNAMAILAEKINTEVQSTTIHIDAQDDSYGEEGKSIDAAKSYKRKHTENAYAVINREAKQLQEKTLYNKKKATFYSWVVLEIPKKDRKELLKDFE